MCHCLQWHRCPHSGIAPQTVPAWAARACGALDSVSGLPGLHQHARPQPNRGMLYFTWKIMTTVYVLTLQQHECVWSLTQGWKKLEEQITLLPTNNYNLLSYVLRWAEAGAQRIPCFVLRSVSLMTANNDDFCLLGSCLRCSCIPVWTRWI